MKQLESRVYRVNYSDFIRPVEQTLGFSCGPMSLKMVYKALGLDLSEGRIASELHTTEEGTDWKDMIYHPTQYGFNTIFTEHTDFRYLLVHFERTGYPMIVGYSPEFDQPNPDGHYSPIKAVTNDHIMLADPAYGSLKTYRTTDFTKRWFDEEKRRACLVILPK